MSYRQSTTAWGNFSDAVSFFHDAPTAGVVLIDGFAMISRLHG